MFILYDLVFLIVAIVHLPVYLLRGKFHKGFLLRLGILPRDLKLAGPIWIHAVSLGEALMMRNLVAELRKGYPQKKFVLSTVTATGNKIANSIAQEGDLVTYLPLDFSFIVRAVINKIKPSLFIIAETEIWPNLISCLRRKNIPIAVVNGRISDNSFKGYCLIKFILSPILNKVSLFCAQTQRDAQRLVLLGVSSDKIKITGNMKFDCQGRADNVNNTLELKQKLGLGSQEKLLVAASTHPGEEKIVLNIYQGLIRDFPGLRLLIAPRHPERTRKIEEIVNKFGFQAQRLSQLSGEPVSQLSRHTGTPAHRHTVFILDTIGQLIDYYALADIVFVGGSLVKKGGHNILEPAALGKPVLFGPQMSNFRDIAEMFLKNQAGILARNTQELKSKIRELLDNPGFAAQFSQRAQALILDNQGATQRNLELIKELLSHQ
ncbi:MAG: 3-deoxy-D-manno-octulosonic acid transferase [Candidatus Omnitrophica bacterium]|nr:3-deoxy-D-manno-octulosonic acid transferase [Candidatus Omnitrophota bacterium]